MDSASLGMHLQTLWGCDCLPAGTEDPSQVGPGGKTFGWQTSAGQSGLNDRDLKFFDAMRAVRPGI
jgi:hypothetical protein